MRRNGISINRTTGRRLGQVLVDLGYIDDGQLWEILDEAKNMGLPLGQVAVSKGLLTETQLLQALADQFGIKFVAPEELKPTTEALVAIPETAPLPSVLGEWRSAIWVRPRAF